MKNTGRHSFDDQWKHAFEDAESPPSEKAWISVEGTLDKMDNAQNKKRIIFYQRAAAALLVATLGSVIIAYVSWSGGGGLSDSTDFTAQNEFKVEPEFDSSRRNKEAASPSERSSLLAQQTPAEQNIQITSEGNASTNGIPKKAVHSIKYVPSELSVSDKKADQSVVDNFSGGDQATSVDIDERQGIVSETEQNSLASSGEIQSTLSDSVALVSQTLTEEEEKALVAKLLGDMPEAPSEKKKNERPLWASLGASGGSYTPGSNSSSSTTFTASNTAVRDFTAVNSTIPVSERSKTGTSYSVGFQMGKPIGNKWIIQAGLSYLNQQINYTSNVVALTYQNTPMAVTAETFEESTTNRLNATPAYKLTSTSEYLSVPIQVGYMIIDKKFGILVNAGIATDLFLRNTLVDQSGQTDKATQKLGDSEVYETMAWAGLTNAEFSYRLADRYRIALVPGVRYSFTNLTRDQSITNRPLVLDVGFRFRYMFH
jgi:hypothetical protein